MEGSTDAGRSLPESWRAEVREQLAAGEAILAWFEPDLDRRLCFARRLVVLTDRRLLAFGEPEAAPVQPSPASPSPSSPSPVFATAANADASARWQSWPLSDDLRLRAQEHIGLGTLDLATNDRRLAHWKYTLGAAAMAHRFVSRYQDARSGASSASATICPSCGAVVTADDGVCPFCNAAMSPRAIASLYRLISFAKPRAKMIALGFRAHGPRHGGRA